MFTEHERALVLSVLNDNAKDKKFIDHFLKTMKPSSRKCSICGKPMIEALTFSRGNRTIYKVLSDVLDIKEIDTSDKTYVCIGSCYAHMERDYLDK